MGWCETCRNPRTSAPPDPPQWRTWLERRTPPCPPPPLSPAIVLMSRKVHHYQRERTNRRVATSLNASFTLSDFIAAMHASTFTILLENIIRFGACNAFGCSAVLVQSYIGCTYGVAMSQSISSDFGLSENWKQLVQSWNIKKSSTQWLKAYGLTGVCARVTKIVTSTLLHATWSVHNNTIYVNNVKNYDSLNLNLDRAKESINQPSEHHSIKCNRVLLCYCFKLFVDHMWCFCHVCSLYSLSLFPKAKASRLSGQGRELWNLTSSQNQMGRLLLSRFTKESVSRILNLHSSCALHNELLMEVTKRNLLISHPGSRCHGYQVLGGVNVFILTCERQHI